MYITGAIYHDITGRDESEATQARIERACRLLDARIGNYPYRGDWKLDMDKLRPDQVSAVQEWVCGMIISFEVNNDGAQVVEGVSLGRFSLAGRDNGLPARVPDQLIYPEMLLKSSGLIRRYVPIR